MICTIIRRDDSAIIGCQLDAKTRASFSQAWRMANAWIRAQDTVAWAKLITPLHLEDLASGSEVIRYMGRYEQVHLEQRNLHHALAISYLVALRGTDAVAKRRTHLLYVLAVLAEACCYRLELLRLPLPVDISHFGDWSPENQRTYRAIHVQVISKKKVEITLADACRLLLALPTEKPGQLRPLLKQLWWMTASYRAALDELLGKKL